MELEQFLQPLFFLKIVLLLLIGGYGIFALVILNQVKTMNVILHSDTSTFLFLVALLNVLAVALVFVAALVIL